jgi:hypothetical protein
MENKKLPPRLVRNAGVFYVCHRLSQMGWNALPSARYAKGPNVVIDSEDEERRWRLKVRSLSTRKGSMDRPAMAGLDSTKLPEPIFDMNLREHPFFSAIG